MELANHFRCDPAVLFSPAEMRAELQRWKVEVPSRSPEEPAPLYLQRLRLVSHAPTVAFDLLLLWTSFMNTNLKI